MPEGWGHFLGQLVGCLRTGDAYGGHVLEEIVHGHGFSISSGWKATIGKMDLGELEVKLASHSINELCVGHWMGNSFRICFGLVGIGLSLINLSFSDSALTLLLTDCTTRIE